MGTTNLAVTQFTSPVIQFTSEDTRLNLAIRAVNRILNTGPSVLSNVMKRTKESCEKTDDIREIAAYCGALVTEMQDGSVKEYLTRFQAAIEEYAEAYDIDEDYQLRPDERIEGMYFVIEINGRLGDLVISLTPDGEKEIESRLSARGGDPHNRIFCEMLLDDGRLAFKVLDSDAVRDRHTPIVSDDFDEVDGKAVRVGRAWCPVPQDDDDDERELSVVLEEDGLVNFHLISGFERFPGLRV